MDPPRLSLAEWEDTRLYLQLVCQIVGKTRLALHPPLNHWWHVTLYPSARGLSTAGIPVLGKELEILVDLVAHRIVISLASETAEIPLGGPICDIYTAYLGALRGLGIKVEIDGKPYKCKSKIPFALDREHSNYDPAAAGRASQVLSIIARPFTEFRGRFIGKCSPVHMFWHSFDLACTRFSGRRAPPMPQADPVTREAYSHEVISAGFWFGDDNLPEAAFYCYAAPAPDGLDEEPLRPAVASWQKQRGSPMAILRYEDVRTSDHPERTIIDFLQSSYDAGAKRAGWNRDDLERNS